MKISTMPVITIQKFIRGFLARKRLLGCKTQYTRIINRKQSVFIETFQGDRFGIIDIFSSLPKQTVIKTVAEQQGTQIAGEDHCISIDGYTNHSFLRESSNLLELQIINSDLLIPLLAKPLTKLKSCQIFVIIRKPLIEIELSTQIPGACNFNKIHETKIIFEDPLITKTENDSEAKYTGKIYSYPNNIKKLLNKDEYKENYCIIIKPYVNISVLHSPLFFELSETAEVSACISNINMHKVGPTPEDTESTIDKRSSSPLRDDSVLHEIYRGSSKNNCKGSNSEENMARITRSLKPNSENTVGDVKPTFGKIECVTKHLKDTVKSKGLSILSPSLNMISSKVNSTRTNVLPPLKSTRESKKELHNMPSDLYINPNPMKKESKIKLKVDTPYGNTGISQKLPKNRKITKKKTSGSGVKINEGSRKNSCIDLKIKIDDFRSAYNSDWNNQISAKHIKLEAKIKKYNESLPKLKVLKTGRSRIGNISRHK